MMRALGLCAVFFLSAPWAIAQTAGAPKEPPGILPVGKDGKPLNLDFETGTLKDWTADGDAFEGQPIKGDTVHPRRGDSKSRHQGQYWLGGFERRGDKPQGTLTSVPFKVTHPWASFLVGGGPHVTTCVELARKDTGELIFRAIGLEQEDMRRVAVDLKGHLGKEIVVRVVDKHSGHWGHVNFDDFRFHEAKPAVPPPPAGATPDQYKFAGLPPHKAAEVMTVPDGFEVRLFAGEPNVVQPVAMCLDDRGRVWVAEAYSYPVRRNDKDAKDRILIFEDTDGNGQFDKRTVFLEGLNLVSGIEVGFGGVWIGAAPHFLFVPMHNDRPTGPPQVLLDGWGFHDTHETLNSFIWGPDGWLYGCHGVFTHSKVGKPGTPDAERVPLNAGVWRYHPTRHVFEVFAHGTSNPWGLDFNDQGQAFVEACVIPHCFHIIQGARYHRQAGPHFNPHTYDDIKTIADHFHYVGVTPHGGNNRSDSAGGGHAHCGLMCYLGGTWPEQYRGGLFMGNIHGRRLNVDVPKAKGSGYVASHSPDFLLANDAWARFINLRYGPDGNVFLIDWYDKQACHHNDPKIWDRSNGRIYKISHRDTKPVQVNLNKCSEAELVEYQTHDNDWYVRHARRQLQERGKPSAEAVKALDRIAFEHENPRRRLRGLWALHVTGQLDRERIERALEDKDAYVRGWAIQLALEKPLDDLVTRDKLVDLAANDPSPVVRRYLASAAQKLQFNDREPIVRELLGWDEDATDHNLPLLYWYALEPLAGVREHRAQALDMALKTKIPPLLAFTVRRITSPDTLDTVVAALAKTNDAAVQLTILRGIGEALKGQRQVAEPLGWPDVFAKLAASPNNDVRSQAFGLAVTFGDTKALDRMRAALVDDRADPVLRRNALDALAGAKDKELVPLLHQLLDEPALRGPALRGLAGYDDPKTADRVLGVYSKLTPDEKRDALATLASRPAYGKALLGAVVARAVPAADLSADLVRQLRNLRDKELDKQIADVWGTVRDTPADRAKLIAAYRKQLTTAAKPPPDPRLGRAIFAKTCAQCHTLFGEGGKVGPDITGANRGDLGYLLENILDPSAVIQKEYAATVIETTGGRVVTGIVKAETPAAVTVVTANETLTLPRDEVATRQPTPTSMMPDDLLKTLSNHEVRSLIAYLQSPAQVPALTAPGNDKDK